MRVILAALLLAGSVAGAQERELELEDGGSLTIRVTEGLDATLSRGGDWVTLTGPGAQELRFEVPLFLPDVDRIAGLSADFNGDGFRDLLVRTDVGYGGVNLFHEILIWREGDGWQQAGVVSNPIIDDTRTGFTASARSGPFWYHERWDIGPDGLPYRQAVHAITFAGFELREVFAPDGTQIDRLLVAEGLGLYDDMKPMVAKIGSDGASAQSPDPDGMAIALWLEPGTEVTLRDWDEPSMLVEVETAEGTKLWIDPEALNLE